MALGSAPWVTPDGSLEGVIAALLHRLSGTLTANTLYISPRILLLQ
jgi:hypothetical protein